MNEWITDRMPTADDADSDGFIWVSQDEVASLEQFDDDIVEDCDAWHPKAKRPSPYVPPNPDTSLAASIEREQAYLPEHGMACLELMTPKRICRVCDKKRILEAAKSWDELGKVMTERVNLAAKLRGESDKHKAMFRGTGKTEIVAGKLRGGSE